MQSGHRTVRFVCLVHTSELMLDDTGMLGTRTLDLQRHGHTRLLVLVKCAYDAPLV